MEQTVNSDNSSGFTLIEFCVAVLIMMVGLMGLLQAVNMTTSRNLQNIIRNDALSVAEEESSLLRSAVTTGAAWTALASSSKSVNRQLRGGFTNYSVATTIGAISTNTKSVGIRIAWRYKGAKYTHAITSTISNPQPIN